MVASFRSVAFWVLTVGLLLGGCGDDDEATSAPQEQEATEESASAEQTSPAAAPEQTAWRTHLDFLTHRGWAELRQGDALAIDFGTPGGHKYTLGGWRTRIGDDHRFRETTTTLISGVTGEVILPAESFAPARLRVRGRIFGDDRVTVYLNGETVGHRRLPRDGSFGEFTIDLDEGELHPGENALQFRVPRRGRADGVQAGLALDWLRLEAAVADSETEESETAEAVETPAPPALTGEALTIPAGWNFGYAFEVVEGATLRLQGSGALRVKVHRDGIAPAVLRELDSATLEAGVTLDLEAYEGRVIRVDLEATADVSLTNAEVVIPAEDRVQRSLRRVRNVVVFLVDTVRADKLSPWNPETRVQTPGLDALVQRSAVFARGATQENWTKPSVATLLTGLLPWQHTATSGEAVLPRSVEMLSEHLRDAEFYTGAFICNGYVSDAFGFRQGWSTWRNYIREGRRSHARFVAADVLEWLDERPQEKPFFLYVHTIDPHVPYIPPPEILAQYDPEQYEGPVDFRRDRELLEKIKIGSLRLAARDRRRLEALYDGEITYHDIHFRSIVDGLERRGVLDETMFVFTADHGEEFFDHDSVGHGHSLFQELLHVPLIMRLPGLTEPVRIEENVGLVDVMPTVLDALGREVPERMAGRSVLPLLRGEGFDAPRPNVAGFMAGWRSIWMGQRKLIQRTHRRWMLYDLEADPGETRDLSEERPLEVRYLRGLLGLALAGHVEARHEAETTQIDPELDAQLRALGYVGTQRR